MKYWPISTVSGVFEPHSEELTVAVPVSFHAVDGLFPVLDILKESRVRVSKQNVEQPAADVLILFQFYHPQKTDTGIVAELNVSDIFRALLPDQLGVSGTCGRRIIRVWIGVDRFDATVTVLHQRDHTLHLRVVRTAFVVLATIQNLREPHSRFRRRQPLGRIPIHNAVQIVHGRLMLLVRLGPGLRITLLHGEEPEEVGLDLPPLIVQVFVFLSHFAQFGTIAE